MAKSHRLPFAPSNSVSTAPLDIVHSDLWGPAPLLSKNGFRYYVLFIDDFSRFTWIYFLHTKDELSHVFSMFKAQIENLLSTTIKMLRTDGGTEYKPLARLFPQLLHQTTCPYTPQQNGTAERKHRHIVELAIATMQHAAIPLQFWDEVFASTVFLINRLPSSTSPNSPYSILFNKPPDYTLLRVLGCLCFPYTRPYTENKLQPRSLPCVFLGYCHSQKGYKCLHIPTNKIYISRHVVFDENTFPFRDVFLSGASDSSAALLMSLTSLFRQCTEPVGSPARSAEPLGSPACSAGSIGSPTRSAGSIGSSARSAEPLGSPTRSAELSISSFTQPDPPDRVNNSPPDPPDRSPDPPDSSQAVTSLHPMITRTRDNTRKPRQFPDHVAYLSTSHELEPLSFVQAQSSPHWRQAMASELDAQAMASELDVLVDQNIVGCKWV